jgi:Ca2+-binding EF-hand superfamily protein
VGEGGGAWLLLLLLRTLLPWLSRLLVAARFFDRTGCGQVRQEDLRRLLHALGAGLPNRLIKSLTAAVVDKRTDKLHYR